MIKLSFLLAAATPLFAASRSETRVEKLTREMAEVRTETVYGNIGAKTATAAPTINRFGPSFHVQALLWQPFEGGTEYAFTDNTSPPSSPYIGEIVQFNFDWQWGFRLGVAYQFVNPDWQLLCDYTRLKFHTSKHTEAPTGGSLNATGIPADGTDLSSADASWAIAFSTLDFTLARPYFATSTLSFAPAVGVRTAWIIESDQVRFVGENTPFLKNVSHLSSIGILGGSQMNWRWTKNWGFYSSLAGSLLYGKFSMNTRNVLIITDVTDTVVNVSDDTFKVLPNVSFNTGLKWEMCLNRVRLFASAGYEFEYFWGQNQRPHLEADTTYTWFRYAEDLGFQGVVFNAGVDF